MKNFHFSLFFKYNLFVTTILYLVFLVFNKNYDFLNFTLVFLGSISTAVLLYVIYYIVLFFLKGTGRFVVYLSGLIFIFTNISLVVDFFIFRLYKYHINAMVLNILMSPDARDSIQLGSWPIVIFTLIVLFFILIEVYFIKKIFNIPDGVKEDMNKSLNRLITIPFILIFLTEKISYGFASLFNKNDILIKFKVVPLYQPLTFNKFVGNMFGLKPDVEAKNTVNQSADLKYPLKKLELIENPNKINIIIIASDAVRNEILNKQTAPNLEEFKKESLVFNKHHTGGNATRFGIFSLMYGINSTYWFNFFSAAKGSIFFDVLKSLDYDIHIISSTDTNWPEFRKTAYVNILDGIKDDFEGSPWQKDKQSTAYFLNMIDSHKKDKPLFSFVFMDAPHGYSFPPKYNKFKASDSHVNYLTIDSENEQSVKNTLAGYKNAVYFNDDMFKKMIDKLKEKDLYDNSLIIYTGDHGEEFYENGFFGHNSAFSKYQTNTPFIVKLPKNMQMKNINLDKLTSHVDVVPTLLKLIGVKNDSSDYSNGYDIFDNNIKREYVFSANWNNNAIITDDDIYVFSNVPNKMFRNEIRDAKSYKIVDRKINNKYLLDTIRENSKFLK